MRFDHPFPHGSTGPVNTSQAHGLLRPALPAEAAEVDPGVEGVQVDRRTERPQCHGRVRIASYI